MKKIKFKIESTKLEWSQQICHYKSMGIFPQHSRAANSTVRGLIWLDFKHIQDFMVVFVTWKEEEDPIKNEGIRVVTIFRRSKAANSEVSDGILRKFKLIQSFMVGLVTCKNEEDPSKNEGTRVVTTFL